MLRRPGGKREPVAVLLCQPAKAIQQVVVVRCEVGNEYDVVDGEEGGDVPVVERRYRRPERAPEEWYDSGWRARLGERVLHASH